MGMFGDPYQKFLRLAKLTVRKMEQKGKPAHEYKSDACSIMGWHVHTLISGHYVLGSEELWLGESIVLASTGELYKYVSRTREFSWESYGGTRTEEETVLTLFTPVNQGTDSHSLTFFTDALKNLPSRR